MNLLSIANTLKQNGLKNESTAIGSDFLSIFPESEIIKEFLIQKLDDLYRILVLYENDRIDLIDEIETFELIPLLMSELNGNNISEC